MGNVLMELRKCCNHPYLLKGAEAANLESRDANLALRDAAAGDATLAAMVEASGKLALLDSMFPKLMAGGHRMLVYSQFTSMLDILEDWLLGRRWGYQRIDGEVGEPCPNFPFPYPVLRHTLPLSLCQHF